MTTQTGRILLVLLFGLVPSFGQVSGPSSDPPPLKWRLQPVEMVPISLQTRAALEYPFKCDADGNLYFRTTRLDDNLPPLFKIDKRGERDFMFSPADSVGADGAYGFFVHPDGQVSMLAVMRDQKTKVISYSVVSWDKKGKLLWHHPIEAVFRPDGPIAVFPSDDMLITGQEVDARGRGTGRPFTGLFGADGKLKKKIVLPGDKELTKEVAAATSPDEQRKAYRPVSLGTAELGADGNVYILRGTKPATVYVISPAGELVRTIKVAANNSDLQPTLMHLSGGELAIIFDREGPGVEKEIQVVRIFDGEVTATYQPARELGGAFFCYARPRFGFITTMKPASLPLAITWAELK